MRTFYSALFSATTVVALKAGGKPEPKKGRRNLEAVQGTSPSPTPIPTPIGHIFLLTLPHHPPALRHRAPVAPQVGQILMEMDVIGTR